MNILSLKQLFFGRRSSTIDARSVLLTCAALGFAATAAAAEERASTTIGVGSTTGSTAFCLYELPPDEFGRRRWINLGIVQYIEAKDLELKIYYGGGSFGSGYEAKLSLAKPEDAIAAIEKIRKAAAACR